MGTDRKLEEIIQEIRGVRESYGICRDETPDSETPPRLIVAADALDHAVLQLEAWLDDHGPEALKDPHRGEDRWHGYVPLAGVRRSWWRRLVS